MNFDKLYDQISDARDKTHELIEIVNTRNIGDVGTAVDELTEEESKMVLKMILMGEWEKLK